MTGARYDRRISRGRSYIRRTYAERKFPGRALSYRGRGLQGADRDHAQTLCEIEKPEKLLSVARRTSGQRATGTVTRRPSISRGSKDRTHG